jgi:hypothetical protein
MTKIGLDCLIMHNSNVHLGGYVRYFTDIPVANLVIDHRQRIFFHERPFPQ